ncbi:MAG: hypothetical protein HYX72_00680 [Acidobacteria bacterium]|nr:hypothetical protein [Acidobacteriota bacterium]
MRLPAIDSRLLKNACSESRVRSLLIIAAYAIPSLLAAQSGVWERRAPFPVEATEVAAAAIGLKVYVVGGLLPTGSTNRLFIYDSFTDTWTEGAPLPVDGGVDHANVAALNGKFYFLGGIRIGSSFVTGRTFEYDPGTNEWTERASMPTPRGASGVAALAGRIYVAGGIAAGGSVNTFEAFDPLTNSWTTLPAMPTARDHLTAQAVNGKFYTIAGRRDRDLNVNEEYDPMLGRWSQRAPIPTARGGLGSGTIGGRIQVFGGEGASGTAEGTFSQNEEYDPATNTWSALAPMPTPRHGIYGATMDGNRIFVPSGGPRAGAFFADAHEAFYLPPSAPPSIDADGVVNAASFQPGVAPGSIATLFGMNLAPAAQTAARLPLPTQMNATSVLVNGVAAPLFFVSANQINFQVPLGTTAPATISVREAGSESITQPLASLKIASPGIFAVSQDGKGQGAILHVGGGLVSAANPATPGEAIEIYCTGLGPDISASTDIQVGPLMTGISPGGQLIGTAIILVLTNRGVSFFTAEFTVGGIPAEILFVGSAPGFIGLNQVNIRVPSGMRPGDAIPVRMKFADMQSNEVSIAIR